MDNHIIFESILNLRKEAERVIASSPSSDEDKKKMFDRLFDVLSLVETKLKVSDFSFTSSARIHELRGKLDELQQRLNNFSTVDSAYQRRPEIDEFINIFLDSIIYFSPEQNVANKLITLENKARTSFNNFKESISHLETESQDIVNRLKELESNGEKLLHIYTSTVIGTDYETRATNEAKKARTWTIFTIISAVSTLIILGVIFIYQFNNVSENNPINYQFLTTKVLLAATLGVIAKWTSKRANRHLLEEAKYHRLALNLTTADAFIKNLDKTKQDEVIALIAGKIFTETTGNETPTDFESASGFDAFKQMLAPKDK